MCFCMFVHHAVCFEHSCAELRPKDTASALLRRALAFPRCADHCSPLCAETQSDLDPAPFLRRKHTLFLCRKHSAYHTILCRGGVEGRRERTNDTQPGSAYFVVFLAAFLVVAFLAVAVFLVVIIKVDACYGDAR